MSRTEVDESRGVPSRVATALARRRTVVVFFSQPGGIEDDATAEAVRRLRGRRGVAVFNETIERLASYRALLATAGVSRAPAIVIVGADRRARLIEGYVDPETLLQQVVDAGR